jgi:phosphoketolase
MTLNRNESKFSSKELNKILPSYLLEEIDTDQPESDEENTNNKSISSNKMNINNILKNQNLKLNLYTRYGDNEKNGNKGNKNSNTIESGNMVNQCMNNNLNCFNNIMNRNFN